MRCLGCACCWISVRSGGHNFCDTNISFIEKYQPQFFPLKLLVLNLHTYAGNAYIDVHILPTVCFKWTYEVQKMVKLQFFCIFQETHMQKNSHTRQQRKWPYRKQLSSTCTNRSEIKFSDTFYCFIYIPCQKWTFSLTYCEPKLNPSNKF